MIVVDSNIITARNLTSALTSKTKQVEEKDPVWIVPVLWRYEFQNILATSIKAKQITADHAWDIWQKVAAILVENETEPSPAKVLDLVAQYGITAHDGQFIALAMEMEVPLVTQDRGLQGKFPRVAVSIDEFLKSPTTRGIGEEKTEYRTRAHMGLAGKTFRKRSKAKG
jgi:predicted nucleic acid-binding protein